MECGQYIFEEYFKVVDLIDAYDVRLLAIKGWSVTFSLVMLGLAFEKRVRFLFLVAAISSICFFLLDATYKNYQTNYYSRMNQIEVVCSKNSNLELKDNEKTILYPSPGIDWAWWKANDGNNLGKEKKSIKYKDAKTFFDAFTNLGTYLPHVFPFIFGILFFFIYPKIYERDKGQANKSLKSTPKSGAS